MAGYDDGEKREAANAVEALDPGVPYESRWAPYVRIHGPGQGQFPKGSIRPRGYMAPDARRSLATPNVATMRADRQRRGRRNPRWRPFAAPRPGHQPLSLMRISNSRLVVIPGRAFWREPGIHTHGALGPWAIRATNNRATRA